MQWEIGKPYPRLDGQPGFEIRWGTEQGFVEANPDHDMRVMRGYVYDPGAIPDVTPPVRTYLVDELAVRFVDDGTLQDDRAWTYPGAACPCMTEGTVHFTVILPDGYEGISKNR